MATLSFLFNAPAVSKVSPQDKSPKGMAGHTHPYHLLKVRVVHLIIQQLLSVGEGHPSCGRRYDVEDGPEGLYDLAIDTACTRDEAWGISGMAFGLMAMNVPDADARYDGQFWGNCDECIAGQPLA